MPCMEAMLTMLPEPLAAMTSPNARTVAKNPVALVSMDARHAASSSFAVFIVRATALYTMPSTRPWRASTRSRSAWSEGSETISTSSTSTVRPAACSLFASAASDVRLREAITSVAPALLSAETSARPSRPVPPNCTMTLPRRENGEVSGIGGAGRGFEGGGQCRDVALDELEALLHVAGDTDHVGADANDVVALGHEVTEGSDQAGGHGEFAVFAGGGGDAFAGGDDLRVIELPGLADAMAEIARAKQQAVETGDGGNGLDLLQRLGRLDLENDEALGVGVRGYSR